MSASTPAAEAGGEGAAPQRLVIPAGDTPLLPTKHTGLLIAAIMVLSLCQFLDLTIANVALPHMQTSLGASMDSISWVLTSFIIAGVLVLPLTGWLSDRIGSRNLYLGAAIAFVLSSMLCGAATSLGQMVLFRAIQGIASALLGPLSQTAMFDINRPTRQASALALWGMVSMLSPICGPFIGGYLTETLNWRWVFYVNLPMGIPAVAVIWWLLPSRPIARRRLDVFGAVMLGLALGALQLMLDRGQHNDWFEARETVIELVVAISAFWVYLIHSRTTRTPLFERSLFQNRGFVMALVFMVVIGVANVGLSSVLPTMFQTVYGYGVIDTGVLMGPRGLGVLITMMAVDRLLRKADSRLLIATGYLIAAVSLWMMTGWSLEMGTGPIIWASFVQGLGLGLVFVPVNMIGFQSLPAQYRTDGSTLLTLFRNVGSSFGISLIVTMIARNMQISHADIAANVTAAQLPPMDYSTGAAVFGAFGGTMLAVINGEVSRQAAMIAYLDNFYLMFWLLVGVAPLAYLVKRPRGFAAGPTVETH